MNRILTQELSQETAREQTAVCDEIAGLARIYDDDTNVCVYRREAHASLRDAAQELAASVIQGPAQTSSVISPAVPVWNDLLPPELSEVARETLTAELNFLAELTADLLLADSESEGAEVGVRLSCGDSPPCPRFHVDRVHARLVTTWLGTGTEWLENRDCERSLLGAPSTADAESGLIRNPERIRQAPEQAIVVLKGEAWPGFDGRGAVHRSPAFSGPRVFVTFEPL